MTFEEFLVLGGRSRAWFETLSPEKRARVRERFEQGVLESDAPVLSAFFEAVAGEPREEAAAQSSPRASTPIPSSASVIADAEPTASPAQAQAPRPVFNPADAQSNAFLIGSLTDALAQTFRLDTRTIQETRTARDPAGGTIQQPVSREISESLGVQQYLQGLWSGATKQQIRELQQRLVRAGYIEEDQIIDGRMSHEMEQATLAAIVEANKSQKALLPWLRERGSSFQKDKTGDAAKSDRQQLAELAKDQYRQQLLAIYMRNWGTAPPPGYIDRIANSGMNTYEFDAHERAKPAFRKSPRYQMDRVNLEFELAQAFGSLG